MFWNKLYKKSNSQKAFFQHSSLALTSMTVHCEKAKKKSTPGRCHLTTVDRNAINATAIWKHPVFSGCAKNTPRRNQKLDIQVLISQIKFFPCAESNQPTENPQCWINDFSYCFDSVSNSHPDYSFEPRLY